MLRGCYRSTGRAGTALPVRITDPSCTSSLAADLRSYLRSRALVASAWSARASDAARSLAGLFPLGALGGLVLAVCGLSCAVGGRRRRWCCRWACPICRFTCGSTRCRLFSAAAGRGSAGISLFSAGYFATGGGGNIRLICLQYHLFLASMAHGAAGRRRVSVHGGLGNDGAVIVFPGDHRSRVRRDPPRRLPLSAGRACRRDRHPAVLRRAAVGAVGLHVRRDAREPLCAGSGRRSRSCSRCSASAPRPACCRCTCGCPKRIRRRHRRCRR